MTSVQAILSSPMLDIEKIDSIRQLGRNLPQSISDQIPLPQNSAASLNSFTIKLLLTKIELINHKKSIELDTLYGLIQKHIPSGGIPAFIKDLSLLYTKIQYEDLLSDYQLLTKPDFPKLMDLVNKKLILVNNVPDLVYGSGSEGSEELLRLVVSIYMKIIDYLLLTGNDFLKLKLLHQLNEKLKITSLAGVKESTAMEDGVEGDKLSFKLNLELPEVTRSLFLKTIKRKLVPLDLFTQFVQCNFNPYIRNFSQGYFIENHLENNVYVLSKYYDIVSFKKIEMLLLPVPPSCTINSMEEIISNMISSDRLPIGTKIDQFDQTLYFPLESTYDKTRDICEIIDEISNLIEIIDK